MKSDGEFLVWTALAIFIPLTLSWMIPTIYRTWAEHRSRTKALDVLRVYAEKGQGHPPRSRRRSGPSRRPPRPSTLPRSRPLPFPNRRAQPTWRTLQAAS